MTNKELDAEFRLAQRKVNMVIDNIYWEAKARWGTEERHRIYRETGHIVYEMFREPTHLVSGGVIPC